MRSIKVKVWAYVMVFTIVILCLLWLLQIVFINYFYRQMKQDNITGAAQAVAAVYGALGGSELADGVQRIAEESDISVTITDEHGEMLLMANPVGRDYATPMKDLPPTGGRTLFRDDYIKGLAQEILADADGELLRSYMAGGRLMLMCGKVVRDDAGRQSVLITSSSLQPLGDTISILSRQLVYVSVILFVLAAAVSLIIANRVSRPLITIAGKARLLATGDYSMTFEGGKYAEAEELAASLNYATRSLQQVERMRNELIANVSHDLRTPLTMIRVYAEMIRDISRGNPEACEQNAAVIMEETDRLTAMVQDILDLSKLQAGASAVRPAAFDLTQAIRAILGKFGVLLRKEGYDILFEQEEPVYVRADERQIEKVLYNLLSNAVNHTGADKTVRVAILDKETRVRVLISDTGKGIKPEETGLIWERYYKASDGRKQAVSGTGLGLAIVRSILVEHDAPYGVDSVEGSGSTFWFELEKTREENA